jgi:Tetracyclin repressor-like, C-terminal domain
LSRTSSATRRSRPHALEGRRWTGSGCSTSAAVPVAVLQRGIRRGELSRGLDIDLALDVLGGAMFYRLLLTGGPTEQRLAEGVVELILRGFAPTDKGVTADANPRERRKR